MRLALAAALATALSVPAPASGRACVPADTTVIARAPGAVVYRHGGARLVCAGGKRRPVLGFARGGPRRFALTWRRGRFVELIDAGPRGLRRLDRGSVRVPEGLRSERFGVVAWRRGRDRRGAVAGVSGCPGRGYGRTLTLDRSVTVYERRAAGEDGDYEGAVFGCARREGVRWQLTTTVQSFDYGEQVDAARRHGPYVALTGVTSSSRGGERSAWLVVHDLRTGAETASGATGPVEGRIGRFALSATGAAAFTASDLEWTGPERPGFDEVRRVWTVRGRVQRELDEGDAIDLRSLRLDGTHLWWRHGDERRTAELP